MKTMTSPFTLRRQSGFTLIEMMVAVAVGLFMMALIGGIYVASTRSFTQVNALTGMDENARVIFEMIGSRVRQAGFNGCGRIQDVTQGDTRQTGLITGSWSADTTQPVGRRTLAAGASRLDGSGVVARASEVLVLVGVDAEKAVSVISDNGVTITTGPHRFIPGDMLLATSCRLNSFFFASNTGVSTVGSAGTITHANGNFGNCASSLAATCATSAAALATVSLPAGATIMPLRSSAFYVDTSEIAGKGGSLWACDYEVKGNTATARTLCAEQASGVENLALWFGLDTNQGGSVTSWVQPGATTNWDQVIAVRVHLLLASTPDAGAVTTGSNTYKFNNGTDITPTDGRIYREYTSTFSIRNRTL
jgi:type IV pilus assembly protein PilW